MQASYRHERGIFKEVELKVSSFLPLNTSVTMSSTSRYKTISLDSPSEESFAEFLPMSENEKLFRELQETNKTLLSVIQRLEERQQPAHRSLSSSIKRFFHKNAQWLLALPNLLATFIWLAMLLYFTGWYLSLTRDSQGRHPQICEAFSLWPYISCIGEKQPQIFRGVCISMAILITTSFLLLCHISKPVTPGLWLKRAAAFFAIVSSCALITLSMKSIDEAPTAHLVATTIQIFAMGNTKFFDWLSNAMLRKHFRKQIGSQRRVRPLEVSRWLKTCVAAFAAGKFLNFLLACRLMLKLIGNSPSDGNLHGSLQLHQHQSHQRPLLHVQ